MTAESWAFSDKQAPGPTLLSLQMGQLPEDPSGAKHCHQAETWESLSLPALDTQPSQSIMQRSVCSQSQRGCLC